MRAKLADAYSQAGGDDEKAARILGACLGSARLAKRWHLSSARRFAHDTFTLIEDRRRRL
jgi:hypothetical protein